MEADDLSSTVGEVHNVQRDDEQEEDDDCPQRTLLWCDSAREGSDVAGAATAVPSLFGPFDVSQFYDSGRLADLRIVCADGDLVRAHQVVLGATCAHAKRYLIR